MNKIKNKKDFYRLSSLGLCGNTPKTWDSVKEYFPYRNKYQYIGIRRTVFSHKRSFARVHFLDLQNLLNNESIEEGTYVISEVPSPACEYQTGLQGELSWLSHDDKAEWVLYYTDELGYMRDKLKKSGRHAYGWDALRLIKGNCTPSEYQEFIDLFEYYTDKDTGRYPVIEFAIMKENFGRLDRRLVIWEIRNDY